MSSPSMRQVYSSQSKGTGIVAHRQAEAERHVEQMGVKKFEPKRQMVDGPSVNAGLQDGFKQGMKPSLD